MEWWQAAVLGLVEGVTEYLPVSSTGHLVVCSALLGLDDGGEAAKRSVDAFNIVVQGGAILAVAIIYWPRVRQMLRGILGKDGPGVRLLLNLAVAFVPAAALGLVAGDWIEATLFRPGPVVLALAVGGVYMVWVEFWRDGRLGPPRREATLKELEDLTVADALVIGLLQCAALWPGVSRSLMTITGGLFVRLRPAAAAEFSFLLGMITLTAASLYTGTKDILAARADGRENFIQVLGITNVAIGIAVASVSAALAVKWLVGFLNRHGLELFGWYRIALAGLLLILAAAGMVTL